MSDDKEINRCPICGLGNGCLCVKHSELASDFGWLRDYINGLEDVDKNTLYVIETSLANRKSLIINDVKIKDGRMQIEEKLESSTCTSYMRRILKEIQVLEKARFCVIEILRKREIGS